MVNGYSMLFFLSYCVIQRKTSNTIPAYLNAFYKTGVTIYNISVKYYLTESKDE
jgi:hypothetical protein